MALTVWKFPLEITDVQDIAMPAGAQILTAAEQRGVLCLWAIVDPARPNLLMRVTIVGTGHTAPGEDEADYIGTVLTSGGDLVWHVFARRA